MLSFKFIKRWLCLALCLVLCLPMLPGTARAIDPIDLEAKTSLSMVFCPGDRPAEGAKFHVWRVGEPDQFCNFTKTEAFADYDVVVTNLDADGWADLANTLSGYVARDKIQPDATATVNKEGKAVFSDLPTGLYLVTGDVYKYGRYTYTPSAIMVSLPSRDAEDQWHYDVTAKAKYTEDYNPGGGGSSKTSLKVVKIWEDDGKETRPAEVVIQLLKDGEVYDTVTLNEGNSWRHTWTNLSKSAKWQVVEKTVPEGYAVLVSNDSQYTFTVTNTSESDIPPGPPPLDPRPPEDPPENPPENPPGDNPPGDTPPGNTPPGNNPPGNTPPPNLPQTGMLWWPVPVLAVSGMGCFLAGWVKDRKDEDHEA